MSVELKAGEPPRVIAHASIAEVSVGEVSKPGRLERLPGAAKVALVPVAVGAFWLMLYSFAYLFAGGR